MSNNQDPSQHIIYPQSYAYPTASTTMGTWGQPQPQQPVPYAFPYQGDMGSYNDKSAYAGAYPMQYGGDSDYYRNSYYNHPQQAHSNQWQPGAYPSYTNQVMYGTYTEREQARAATFNPGAALPNMSRPPPNMKRENGENTFHASLSMLENPSHSAAAYTASWVSSTSSIPPELKDEPEFAGLPRDELGGNIFTPPTLTDQFGGLSVNDTTKDESQRNKKQDRGNERKGVREEPKELTWDERLRKAQVQKERVEQRGGAERVAGVAAEREKTEREVGHAGNARGIGSRLRGGAAPGGQRQTRDMRDNRSQRNATMPVNNGMMWKNSDFQQSGGDQRLGCDDGGNQSRMQYVRPNGAMQIHGAMNVGPTPLAAPMPVFTGQPQMMMRSPRNPGYVNMRPVTTQPTQMINMQQDERFKNTWLDANAFVPTFPMQFQPVTYGMEGRMRGRGRGGPRSGVTRGSNNNRREYRRDERREELNNIGGKPSSPVAENGEHVDPSSESSPVPEQPST